MNLIRRNKFALAAIMQLIIVINWYVFLLIPAVMLVASCSPGYSPDTYASSAVQQASKVEQGVIVGTRAVGVQASGATGAVTGAAAGGIVASQAPGSGVGNALTTLGGTLVGGLVGAGIERAGGDTTATEYIVRKGNGELVSVTQKDAVPLKVGTKVLVIAGSQARIVADYNLPIEPSKEPGTPKLEILLPETPKLEEAVKPAASGEVPIPVSSEALPTPATAPATGSAMP
jgi:outer membrane lipoprotein SlyB